MAELDIDLRLKHMQRAQAQQPRLPQNLRQLGAVGPYVPAPPAGSQQTVVKGWISRPHTTGDHLRYLEQGKGRQGSDAVLFGPEGAVDTTRFVAAATKDYEQYCKQFRFSVSLKDVHPFFPMRPYIEALMAQVQRDLGRPLDWVAAVHHDTPHLHVHVVLRGRDLDGKPLFITTDYLSHGLRFRADRIATWMFGPDRSRERTHQRTRQHLTPAQAALLGYLTAQGFRGKTFGDLEVFPARTAQANAQRRVLRSLVAAGVLEQPDPRVHMFRFRAQAYQQVQQATQTTLGPKAEQQRGQEMGL